MFTRTDLDALTTDAPALGVSIFLPTQVRGSEVRQNPIRWKNLVARARELALEAACSEEEADALLAPAQSLVHDHDFWQHQGQGLAVFLGGPSPRLHQVALPLEERVVVQAGFTVGPLLPVLADDGSFLLLTVTADGARLFRASRSGLSEVQAQLPGGVDEDGKEPDYQNPVQASPVARPNTGSVNIANAQVYGDSPADWNKDRLVAFARRVAAAVDRVASTSAMPVVLVANAEMRGHVQKASALGARLAGTIECNPAALDPGQLHEAAWAVAEPLLSRSRTAALDRFRRVHGSRDPRAVTHVEDLVRAGHEARVDVMLISESETVRGPLETASVQTLQHGGQVHFVPADDLPGVPAVAVLRH